MVTIAPTLAAFAGECLRLSPGSQNGGIEPGDPKQGGYHNSRDKLISLGKTGDYSLRTAWDKRGNGSRACAFDWTFPDAQRGDYSTIRRFMTRIRQAYDRNDERLTGWREALGQQDADNDPEGIDFVERRLRTPDMSHMWHIHFSVLRDFVDEAWPYNNMLSILRGDPPGGDVIVDEATERDLVRRVVNADENYLHPTLKMEPNVRYIDGGGQVREMPNDLVRTLAEVRDDVEEIREAVSALQAGAGGGVTQEMLDLAVRRALRSIPEA